MPNSGPCVLKPRAARETYTPLGERYRIGVKLSVDPETGEKKAEPGDKLDLDAYIQKSRASCDINVLMARFEQGDETVINFHPGGGLSGDLVSLPRDLNDVQSMVGLGGKAREKFESLPASVKELFNNDPSEFFNAVLNNKVDSILEAGLGKTSATEVVKETKVEAKKEGNE